MAERTVVQVHNAFPEDTTLINFQLIPLVQVVVNQGRKGIVGSCNSMHISSKVEVDVFHWQNLCIPTTSSTTLDPHDWTKRRFADSNHGFLANLVQGIRKTNGKRRLSFTCRCWVDGSNQDQFTDWIALNCSNFIKAEFSLVLSVQLQIVVRNTKFLYNINNWLQLNTLCDFNICFHSKFL
ncbi:Uncharacterised protein [Streptococcus pneumoniae]|nr:Uncharacterised protein [Streptococcus pneumoniae]